MHSRQRKKLKTNGFIKNTAIKKRKCFMMFTANIPSVKKSPANHIVHIESENKSLILHSFAYILFEFFWRKIYQKCTWLYISDIHFTLMQNMNRYRKYRPSAFNFAYSYSVWSNFFILSRKQKRKKKKGKIIVIFRLFETIFSWARQWKWQSLNGSATSSICN